MKFYLETRVSISDFLFAPSTYFLVIDEKFALWLSPQYAASRDQFYYKKSQDAGFQKHTEGTCQWLTRDPRFQNWLKDPAPNILWIKGDSSSGKTITMTYAVHELLYGKISPLIPGCQIIYFFCSQTANDINLTDFEAILRTLLFQLWKLSKDDLALREVWKAAKESPDLDSEKVKWKFWSNLLKKVLTAFSAPVYVIIDAVDESDNPNDLARELNQLRSLDKVKILFSSRPDNKSIVKHMQGVESISISKIDTNRDMRLHIQQRLTENTPELNSTPISEEFKREIEDTLITKANGLYEP